MQPSHQTQTAPTTAATPSKAPALPINSARCPPGVQCFYSISLMTIINMKIILALFGFLVTTRSAPQPQSFQPNLQDCRGSSTCHQNNVNFGVDTRRVSTVCFDDKEFSVRCWGSYCRIFCGNQSSKTLDCDGGSWTMEMEAGDLKARMCGGSTNYQNPRCSGKGLERTCHRQGSSHFTSLLFVKSPPPGPASSGITVDGDSFTESAYYNDEDGEPFYSDSCSYDGGSWSFPRRKNAWNEIISIRIRGSCN